MAERKLQYRFLSDKVYFYYGEKLLFTNSKSMPFIVLKKSVEGVENALSLDEYEIREEENAVNVLFFNGERKVNCRLEKKDEEVLFTCDLVPEENEEALFTLYKRSSDKIYGLPAFEDAEPSYGFWKRLIRQILHKKYEKTVLHKKLSFFISDQYYFSNQNITDYELELKDRIYLTVRSAAPSFSFLFYKNIKQVLQAKERNEEKIKKYPKGSVFLKVRSVEEEKIKAFSEKNDDLPIKGIVIEKRPFDAAFLSVQKKKCDRLGLDCICSVGKEVCEKHAKKYIKDGKISRVNDISDVIDAYMVIVRKYLDLNISGLYFEDDFNAEETTKINDAIYTVLREYPAVSLFHNTVSEKTADFGYLIVKDKKIVENFSHYKRHYLYSGEKAVGKEESVFTKNDNFSVHILDL